MNDNTHGFNLSAASIQGHSRLLVALVALGWTHAGWDLGRFLKSIVSLRSMEDRYSPKQAPDEFE